MISGLYFLSFLAALATSSFNLQIVSPSTDVVNNSQILDNFRYENVVNVTSFETDAEWLTFWWGYEVTGSAVQADYLMATLISETDVLNVTLSIPPSGTAPLSVGGSFNLTFTCSQIATVPFAMLFFFDHPALTSPEIYTIRFEYDCKLADCGGMCGNGECVNRSCICDEGWNTTRSSCDRFFRTDKLEVCLNEPFNLLWETIDETLASSQDWIILNNYQPQYGWQWPYQLFTLPDIINDYEYQWSYVSGDRAGGVVVPNGSFPFIIQDYYPGPWPFVFLIQDEYNPIAIWYINLLPVDHPRCLSENYTTQFPVNCVVDQGVWNPATNSCDCNTGFFGLDCSHGCQRFTEISHFGVDFASSVDFLPFYTNYQNCSWYLNPDPAHFDVPFEPQGITFLLSSLGTEPAVDTLDVYPGTDTSDENNSYHYSGLLTGSATEVHFDVTSLTINWITNYVNPSWSVSGQTGFLASFRATGCPLGAYVSHDLQTRIWSCLPCPQNSFSLQYDTLDSCTPCGDITESRVGELSLEQRKLFNKNCVPQVQTWRKVLAVMAIVWTGIVNPLSFLLVLTRSTIAPLRSRSTALLHAATVGTCFLVMVPLMDLVPADLPCRSIFWLGSLRIHFFMIPALFMLVRLKVLLDFQKIRKEAAVILEGTSTATTEEEKKHHRNRQINRPMVEITKRLQRAADRVRKWSDPTRLTIYIIVAYTVVVLILLSGWSTEASHFPAHGTLDTENCFETSKMKITDLAFFFVYVALMCLGLYQIREVEEAFGLKKEIFMFLCVYTALSVLYYAIVLSANYDNVWNMRYFIWLIAAIFQFRVILLPGLYTVPGCYSFLHRNLNAEMWEKAGRNLKLEELLAQNRGYNFFVEHCRREFSEENVLCYREIESFRRKTSEQGFVTIYKKFLEPGAPFAVNIPAASRKAVKESYDRVKTMSLTELQQGFDQVRSDLLELMTTDTFVRFIRSDLFARYLRGDQLDTKSEHSYGSSPTSNGFHGLLPAADEQTTNKDHTPRQSFINTNYEPPITTATLSPGGDPENPEIITNSTGGGFFDSTLSSEKNPLYGTEMSRVGDGDLSIEHGVLSDVSGHGVTPTAVGLKSGDEA